MVLGFRTSWEPGSSSEENWLYRDLDSCSHTGSGAQYGCGIFILKEIQISTVQGHDQSVLIEKTAQSTWSYVLVILILRAPTRKQTWEGTREGVYVWMQEQAVYQSGWAILSFRSSTNIAIKVDTFSEIFRKEDGPDALRRAFEWLIVMDWQMQNRVHVASSRQYILTENVFGWKTAVNHMEELESIRNCTFLERKVWGEEWCWRPDPSRAEFTQPLTGGELLFWCTIPALHSIYIFAAGDGEITDSFIEEIQLGSRPSLVNI